LIDPFKGIAVARSRDRFTIGVLASWQLYAGTIHTLLNSIIQGIYAAACEQDCNVLIGGGVVSSFAPETRPAWPFLSPEVDFIPVGPWNTDGLIIIAPHQGGDALSRYLEQVMAIGHPVVFVESAESRPVICPDNGTGIRQVMMHLKKHGHKRLAFIGGGPGWQGDSRERLQAFMEGCEELGLETEQRLMAYGVFSTPGGYQAMRQILDTGVPFTAVVAANDESAVGAIQALRASGLRVPEDVAVVGFDNRFEARNQTPTLTTLNQPGHDIGYQSLKLMLRRLKKEADASTMVRIPARLVIRESCGCPRDAIVTNALDELSQSEESQEPAVIKERLAQTMTEAVFAGVGQLKLETIQVQCERITEAFLSSLKQREAGPFQAAWGDILQPIRSLDEDAHAWQNAITTLRYWWPVLVEPAEVETCREEVNTWLDQARIAISECAQAQLLRYFARQDTLTQQLSLMSAELAEALELSQVQKVINQYLPVLAIRHAQVVLFEPDGDNPVGWSVFPEISGAAGPSSQRFPTQQFPPPSRYPEDQVFHLALLPLAIRNHPAGFVAFDAANLPPCLAVLRQLTSALERIRLYQEAAEGRRLAEEADRMKSRFLSTVSHELRTPLNLIVGLSEMQLKQSTADVRKSVEKIHTNAQHLGHLIRDVLDLASSDAGQLRLTCEPLDMAEVLQIVIETGRQLANDKGLDWQTEISPSLPRVWGDRTRLQQVTLNLVSNAIKFTSQGQVKLSISMEGGRLVIAVRDTGLGIPPEEQAWIFNEFRQSERTTARGYGGLGLGLAICQRLVELHNGEIGVQSSGEEGAGSTFTIRLPIFENTDAFPAPSQPTLRQVVLILTEDPASSQPIQERLQRSGFTVEVQGVDETSNWFSRVLTTPPGAVVLDNQVASKCGWELLRVLKGNPRTEDIPVLFYSLKEKDDTGTMLALDYLSKPVGSTELIKILARQGWTSGNTKGQSKTILIADDEPGFLEMYAQMIQSQSAGYQVLKAHDGREALEFLRQAHVDLVLLDLMMPEIDGFSVLAQMREWESTRNTTVVVLTSKTLTEADMTRLSHGVATVMSKGLYDATEMLSHIEAALVRNKKLGTESQRLVRKAMAYIHEHYTEQLTREELARYVNASEGHLARCFRQETGISPMAYLNRYRVNQAKLILTTTNQSITAVSIAVGFSDNNYFSRVFRQEVGCSPQIYRRGQRV
jgi:signal transduction histidine kinase/DNA-binding response OmpR family regulator/ABC-type sugar transport system substrate-binding protein